MSFKAAAGTPIASAMRADASALRVRRSSISACARARLMRALVASKDEMVPARNRDSNCATIFCCKACCWRNKLSRSCARFNSSKLARTRLRTCHAVLAMFSRAASESSRACANRCPRLPAVSIGTVKLTLGSHGDTPSGGLKLYSGVSVIDGFGRPPAVTMPAFATPHCARATSRLG
jgi:hypothetical protein